MAGQSSAPQSPVILVPGVGSSYKHGWNQIWKHFLELFLIGIIAILLSSPSSMGSWSATSFSPLGFLGWIYGILVSGHIDIGMAFAYLKAARGDKAEVSDVFEAFKNYWNAVLEFTGERHSCHRINSTGDTRHHIRLQVSLYPLPCG